MVMAGAESVSGSTTDESLSSRLQWLRQRREALQEKLTLKNNELKNLCIEEAELTGVLPPEIPLEPGESPPNFRKRSGTNYNYPQNLINKLKTNGVEESALELERQVQINIAEAALAKLNDPNENKTVRRKHRSLYQQSQRRLQELNVQLNFIRQSHGSGLRQSGHIPLHSSQPHLQTTAKHKTKKPRPPLDSSGKDLSPKVESRSFLQEGGISLSPLGPEHNYNTYPAYDYQDINNHYPPSGSTNQNRATYHAPSPVEHRRSTTKFDDLNNANNNVYVPPEHFRNRTYSQGGNSTGSSVSPLHFPPERPHRHVPNTYSEEERQMHYRQLKLKRQESEEMARSPQYPEPPKYDSEHRRSAQIAYYDQPEFNATRYQDGQIHEVPMHYPHGKPQQQPPVLRPRETIETKPAVDAYVPPGYWMRLDDEIVWCTDEQMANDRFGSLDRRKQHIIHHPSNAETQSRYHTVAISGKNAAIPHSRPYPMPPPMSSPDVPSPPTNRILLRTQSLGSVETWPHQHQPPSSPQDNTSIDGGRESADGGGTSSRNSSILSSKPKEKEWYETSLDTGNSAHAQRAIRRASQHNPLNMGPPVIRERTIPVRSNSIPTNRRIRESPQMEDNQQQAPQRPPPINQNRFQESRVLEIPAESKPSPGPQENGNETMIPLNSPTNHTIVQPGMYQPYREVTKPFEMSDFYKYSTKFRKRAEANTTNDQSPQHQQQIPANLNTQNDQNSNNQNQRIQQPVQRNNCPPYNLR